MRIVGRMAQSAVWLVFSVLVAFGSTVYFLDRIISDSAVSVYSVVLWSAALINIFLLLLILRLIVNKMPGSLALTGAFAVITELACFLILTGAGLYFRLGTDFAHLWKGGSLALSEAAMVGEDALLTLDGTDALSSAGYIPAAYVRLLHQCYLLLGNREFVAPGVQLALYLIAGVLFYFLVRRVRGSVSAIFVWGGLMLLPEMIRFSVESSPFILVFLGAVLLGWVLHILAGFVRYLMHRSGPDRRPVAWLDLVPAVLCCVWSVYDSLRQGWSFNTGFFAAGSLGFRDTGLWKSGVAIAGQEILFAGMAVSLIFLFVEERWEASLYALMAVLLLILQLLGLDSEGGLGVLLCVVLSLMAGTGVEALLLLGRKDKGRKTPEGSRVSAGAFAPQETRGDAGAGEFHGCGPEEEPAASEKDPEPAVRKEERKTEIFIPGSMEIPKRKPRARLEFDREFDESELKYDIEVLEDEDYDT